MRDDFERGAFPSMGFKGADLSAASAGIASWLTTLNLAEEERGRLAALLVYWGGNPQTPEQVGMMEPCLFDAFGLRRPASLPTPVTLKGQKNPPPVPGTKSKSEPPIVLEDPVLAEWDRKINAWTAGAEMLQKEATFL